MKNKIPIARGTKEIITPKMTPASISPKRIEERVTGDTRSFSYVFALLSQGVIRGPTEDEVKNRVIAIRPGARINGVVFFPRAKARKKNTGNKIPNMMTGAFR